MNSHKKILGRFKGWLAKNGGYSAGSVDIYLRLIKNFFAFLDAFNITCLKDISPELLLQFVSTKGDGVAYAEAHVRLRWAILHVFFLWAKQMRYCYNNPVTEYRKNKLDARRLPIKKAETLDSTVIILSIPEQQKILGHRMDENFSSIRNKCIVTLLLASGLFAEEIIRLPMEALNLKQGYLVVTNESQRPRYVYLDLTLCRSSLMNWLAERGRAYNPHKQSFLFLTQQGLPLTKRFLYKTVSGYLQKIGISKEHMGPDLLRQTAIVNMIRVGKTLEEVQASTGIQTLTNIEKYKAALEERYSG